MPVNEKLRPLTIHISSAFDGQGVRRHGLFFADLDGRQLCISRRPLLDAPASCSPRASIPRPRSPPGTQALISDVAVGAAAGLTVSEGNTRSATFAALQGLFPCGRRSTGAF